MRAPKSQPVYPQTCLHQRRSLSVLAKERPSTPPKTTHIGSAACGFIFLVTDRQSYTDSWMTGGNGGGGEVGWGGERSQDNMGDRDWMEGKTSGKAINK